MSLKGKVAIVSGAGTGVGKATTKRLFSEGSKVVLIGRDRSRLTKVISELDGKKNLLAAALERIKSRVDPEQFQIFDLYCLEDWPAQKVARTLGVSLGRVYLAKHRIGALLKKELKKLERQTI